MRNPIRLFGCLGAILALLTLSACSSKQVSPTPTPTVEMTSTLAPSDTPVPTELPAPSDTPALAATLVLTGTAGSPPALTPQALTPPPAGATQPATNPGASAPDKAQFVTQNFRDGYRFKPGTAVTIIWTVKNIGTTGWSTSYSLRYFAGVKSEKSSYAFPKTVQPGGQVDLSVNLVVPSALGTYTTWWKLTNGLGQNFSDVDFTFQSSNTAGPPVTTPTP